MLSEEALVLFAATGACALLILGVLELMTPTRPRHARRYARPERDPWRRARAGPPGARPGAVGGVPLEFDAGEGLEPATDAEPPIERLLLSEAATLPPAAPRPLVPPLQPPKEPVRFAFQTRRPTIPERADRDQADAPAAPPSPPAGEPGTPPPRRPAWAQARAGAAPPEPRPREDGPGLLASPRADGVAPPRVDDGPVVFGSTVEPSQSEIPAGDGAGAPPPGGAQAAEPPRQSIDIAERAVAADVPPAPSAQTALEQPSERGGGPGGTMAPTAETGAPDVTRPEAGPLSDSHRGTALAPATADAPAPASPGLGATSAMPEDVAGGEQGVAGESPHRGGDGSPAAETTAGGHAAPPQTSRVEEIAPPSAMADAAPSPAATDPGPADATTPPPGEATAPAAPPPEPFETPREGAVTGPLQEAARPSLDGVGRRAGVADAAPGTGDLAARESSADLDPSRPGEAMAPGPREPRPLRRREGVAFPRGRSLEAGSRSVPAKPARTAPAAPAGAIARDAEATRAPVESPDVEPVAPALGDPAAGQPLRLVDRLAEATTAGAASRSGEASAPPPQEVPAAQAEVAAPPSPLDRCYALYENRQYVSALAEAVPVLESVSSGALVLDARDTARLWGVVALARQGLGDHEGARAAFTEAAKAAPSDERLTWQRHLGTLAVHVAHQLTTQAQSGVGDAEERITLLRSAVTWLDAGLEASPSDEAVRQAAVAARAALWPMYEQLTGELIQRQDYALARRLLQQALAEPDCPAAAQRTLRDLVAATYGGEVGQLTAEAIRRMQEGKEAEAIATLDRAEAMLSTVPAEGVTDKRRQELERRLWWSYTKVGMRRLEGGLYEEAVGPLLHALQFASVGPERLEETKRPLARALESLAEVRSPIIQRLAADGDRDGAMALCEKISGFVRSALERGMSREELASSLNRTQALTEKIGKLRK